MATLYGIPKTLADIGRWVWRSSVITVVWVTLISALLVAIGYFLYLINPFLGGFFASAILAALWQDEVRQIVQDIMLRRWAEL